jgi:hypothetical protein
MADYLPVTRSVAVAASPARTSSASLPDRKAERERDRFGAAVMIRRDQCESRTPSGLRSRLRLRVL